MSSNPVSDRPLTTLGHGRPASWASSLAIHGMLLAVLALFANPARAPLPPTVIETSFAGDERDHADSPLAVAMEVAPQEESSQQTSTSLFLAQVSNAPEESAPRLDYPGDAEPSLTGTFAIGGLSEKVGELRGSGSGSGSGELGTDGTGTGKKSGFFGMKLEGKRIVFVVDASTSMHHPHFGPGGTRFRRVQIELINTVMTLKEDQEFFITFFSSRAWPMPSTSMVLATSEAKKTYLTWVASAKAGGQTEPESALRLALTLRPDVIFFLTDGEIDFRIGPLVTDLNRGRAVIHTVAVGEEASSDLMQKIAQANRGRYRYIPNEERLIEQLPETGEPVSVGPVSQAQK